DEVARVWGGAGAWCGDRGCRTNCAGARASRLQRVRPRRCCHRRVEHGGVDVSLKDVHTAFLLGATVTTGLMAGVFGLYAHTIMRGLTSTDDRAFVGAFQSIDRAILNPLFMLSFLGALVLDAGAAILSFRDDARSQLPWTIAAASLYFA